MTDSLLRMLEIVFQRGAHLLVPELRAPHPANPWWIHTLRGSLMHLLVVLVDAFVRVPLGDIVSSVAEENPHDRLAHANSVRIKKPNVGPTIRSVAQLGIK